MTVFVWSVALLAALGILIGILLGATGRIFAVETDERVEQVRESLPGNNCGACGYPGCDGLAEAIAAGEAEINACPVGGAAAAAKIAEIMGAEASGEDIRRTAYVKCAGTCESAKRKYNYIGEMDCREASVVPGRGEKACSHGCLGLGTCVRECPFDAIHVEDGIARVDREKCVACGRCVAVCPNHVIELVPYDSPVMVRCNSNDKGKDVMAVCDTGCIGCGICVKQCEFGAVTLEDNLAKIDGSKCTGCAKCAEKCPKKIIMAQS